MNRMSLTRPNGTDPDGFARRVAEAYNNAILTTSKPARLLAEEAGVPVPTVHRWIAEARRRGHLSPGRKGVAGATTTWERVAAALGVSVDRLRDVVAREAPGGLR